MRGNSLSLSSLSQYWTAKIIHKVPVASVRESIGLPPGKNAAPSSNGLGPLKKTIRTLHKNPSSAVTILKIPFTFYQKIKPREVEDIAPNASGKHTGILVLTFKIKSMCL